MSGRCFCVEYGLQFLQSSKMTNIKRWRICNKLCINLEKIATENSEMLSKAFRDEAMRINQTFERPTFG